MVESAKGARDYLPEKQILREQVISILKKTFESYGFNPLETPAIERFSTLSSKYAGGEEILKETFKFQDQGKRELGLRYDLTVPLARLISQNPNLKLPFKRYEIGKAWRDGPLTKGRYREFTQCDVDTVGCPNMKADAEIIFLTSSVFDQLKLKTEIRINNRKLLSAIIEESDINSKKAVEVLICIDKMDKIGPGGVKQELKTIITDKQIKKLFSFFDLNQKTNQQILKELKDMINTKQGVEGLEELQQVFDLTKELKNLRLELSLARGLSYYTSTVFEVYLTSRTELKRALAGGGRYDRLIANFLETKDLIPAVGISFGLDIICEALKEKGQPIKNLVTQVLVIPIGLEKQLNKVFSIVQQLRSAKFNTEIDLLDRGVSKNLSYANQYQIPFVILIGEDELKQKKIKLKDMKTGQERLLTLEQAIKNLRKSLKD